MDREAIIAANPILDYCQARGWEARRDGREWKMLCPLHEERTPSFSINPEKRVFHCFGCGAAGSVIDLHIGLRGIDEGAAMRELARGFSPTDERDKPPAKRTQPQAATKLDPLSDKAKARQRKGWPAFETPTRAEIATIATQRDLSREGVAIAAERGLLFCTDWKERRAWGITDETRLAAQGRRLDGLEWDCGKAQSLLGSIGSWPVGIREAQAFPAVALVEGGPDLLAAFHLAWIETSMPETLALGKGVDVLGNLGVVAMLGASADIADAALPLFAGKRVRMFVHNDVSGYSGAKTRTKALRTAGATVDGFRFLQEWRQSDGRPVNDLNDFVRLDVDQWEADRSEVESVFEFVFQS